MEINLPLSPPVNNNIQGNLYDKLDAIAFEKIRVANSQLDVRLSIQEKVLDKYRRDAERVHENQSKKLRSEFRKIQIKKPDYVYDDSDIVLTKERPKDAGRQRSLSESSNNSHCRRYYSHHYQVRDETKASNEHEQKQSPTDFFNLKFRMYFLSMMNNNLHQRNLVEHDISDNRDINEIPAHARSETDIQRTEHITVKSCEHIDDCDDEVFKTLADAGKPNSDKELLNNDQSRDIDACSKSTKAAKRDRRSKRRPKLSRKDTGGTVKCESETNFEVKMEEWKRTKRAFDKIYVGLL